MSAPELLGQTVVVIGGSSSCEPRHHRCAVLTRFDPMISR